MSGACLEILWAMLGSLGFSILYNLRGKHLALGALGGLLSWAAFLAFMALGLNATVSHMLSAMAVALYAQILARLFRSPTTVFLAPAVIPLIPGGSLYETMLHMVNQQWAQGLASGVETLTIAGAISIGLAAASSAEALIKAVKGRIHR